MTDDTGPFEVVSLSPGNYAVLALHGGHPPAITQVFLSETECGDSNDVRIVLDSADQLIPA